MTKSNRQTVVEGGRGATAERKGTLAEEVQQRLAADIISGRLKPGEKLGFEMLKQRYAAGISPLREALQRLAGENLVVFEGHIGFRVAPLQLADLKDINALRRTLEVIALRDAIAHGDVHWEARVVAAAHQLARMPLPTDPHGDEAERWEVCHAHFHDTLISACTSRWTLQFCKTLFLQFRRYRRLILASYWQSSPVTRTVVDQEHQDLVAAVLERDAERAALLLGIHYDNSARRVLEAFERLTREGKLAANGPRLANGT